MASDRTILPLFSPLMRYPHDGQEEATETAIENLADYPGVVEKLREYLGFLKTHTRKQLEEKYTQAFEINPAVALEVGFHLFGLAYQRGAFLARANQAVNEFGIDTGAELSDHLPVMLQLAAALDEDTAVSLIQEAIFPAVRHMAGGFVNQGPGFGRVILALHEYLGSHYECIVYAPEPQAQQEEVNSHV